MGFLLNPWNSHVDWTDGSWLAAPVRRRLRRPAPLHCLWRGAPRVWCSRRGGGGGGRAPLDSLGTPKQRALAAGSSNRFEEECSCGACSMRLSCSHFDFGVSWWDITWMVSECLCVWSEVQGSGIKIQKCHKLEEECGSDVCSMRLSWSHVDYGVSLRRRDYVNLMRELYVCLFDQASIFNSATSSLVQRGV